MSSFIFYGDYLKQIQDQNLQQIISSNNSILENAQNVAIEECKSYLRQKYDISQSFNSILKYDKTKSYKAGQTVYLDADAYLATSTYALGAWMAINGNVYECSTAITTPESFNASHWTLIGIQYSIYYATYPAPIFNYKDIYQKGDQVFWKDKVYTCVLPTQLLSHGDLLQTGAAGVSNIQNIFPDDPIKGIQYWGAGQSYVVDANTPLTDEAWTNEDNRDQKLLQICIDIVLYHIHSRISPKNIPELRIIRYMGSQDDRISVYNAPIKYPAYCALGWLQNVAKGEITPSIPIIQPEKGKRIRFGGNVKNINTY